MKCVPTCLRPRLNRLEDLDFESESMMKQRENDKMSSQTSLSDASDTVEE